MIQRFEDLEVWQLARSLVKDIYEITQKTEFQKDFGLKDQARRCAVSIMANISEGFERKTQKEFINFLFIAKGSCGELRSHIYVAFDLGYINKETFDNLQNKTLTISKSLSGFIKYLSKSEITK
ncbi:MAG: four helix bundle protein [Bacteroidales bacterium]|jgi:four helix bundle protein